MHTCTIHILCHNLTGIGTHNLVRKLNRFCMNVALHAMARNPVGKIGGLGHVIFVDESVFTKRKVRYENFVYLQF